jgi:D-arabinan exo alpha-(1,3)/(1,5)-arabinofuranosidase (non-reducing end)
VARLLILLLRDGGFCPISVVMHRILYLTCCCAVAFFSASAAAGSADVEITIRTLIEEMADLGRLARWPEPGYRTIQFSSYDRRSTTAEAPGWFSNADGFGGEPIPAFLKVLREPTKDRAGLYLLAEVSGPGAVVRGWSAGMGGTLRVFVDPSPAPGASEGTLIWEGAAYDFLARRSGRYLKDAGMSLDARDALSQNDADYLPIPFSRGLRVTWEGKLGELHFYHLQVRVYPPQVKVRTFDPKRDLRDAEPQLRQAVTRLLEPTVQGEDPLKFDGTAEAGRAWNWSPQSKGPGAISELKLKLKAGQLDEALRGCLLRVAFDGSQRPQVEAPAGDFFSSGPGVNPFSSLPFSVEADGTMTCRFVMPYEQSVRLELVNFTKDPVQFEGSVRLAPWQWDERSLYFRAKWRADHDLLAGAGAIDLPYVLTIGKGVFVGCAAMIMNPSGVPTAGGNWWGEGDEKILVDGETMPSTFGTGSEDFFNYSWSRSDLFAHPYCGQPLDSGPDTSGYISNHRFQIMDAIPFEKSIAVLLELWAHTRTPGLSYARVAYHYARPGAVDDHRGLMPSELKIPPLPRREPKMLGGATGARFHLFEQLHCEASAGGVTVLPFPLATQSKVTEWRAEKGSKLRFGLPMEKTGRASLHLVAVYRPDGATIRMLLDGKPLNLAGGGEEVKLKSAYAPRVLNVHFGPVDVIAGTREAVLECLEAGPVALDYLWIKPEQ